jgi:hypothetical protein
MLRYFVFANLWLFVTLCLFLGTTFERSEPLRYSFMGFGAWLSPEAYTSAVVACLLVSLACFIAWWRTSGTCPGLALANTEGKLSRAGS